MKNCMNCKYLEIGYDEPCTSCMANKGYPVKLINWEVKDNES